VKITALSNHKPGIINFNFLAGFGLMSGIAKIAKSVSTMNMEMILQ
jgi:hypothetical protein